jgi:hypothetical protein
MRRKGLIIALVLLVGLSVAAWTQRDLYTIARVGTAYVAERTCSCLFVSELPASTCRGEYDPEASSRIGVRIGPSSVTTSAVGGVFSARAEFEKGFGCHLVY